MATITLDRKELEKSIGKITTDVEEKISQFGTTVDSSNDTEICIEVYPNRPDLLSLQGVVRALSNYFGKSKIKQYEVAKPEKDYRVIVDRSVKQVRPYTACAIVKGMKFDDNKIKELIDIQEKLHNTLGRKRKKLAIGVYPLDKIKLPIRYCAKKPEEIVFRPLEAHDEMTGREILQSHPTGMKFADLLKNEEVFPIFMDANNKILSMPPIINSYDTGRVDENTKDLFIECSGSNLHYLKKTLNILVTALADMGGKICAMAVDDGKESFVSPNLDPQRVVFELSDIERTLGLKLAEKDILQYLEKMGIGIENDGANYVALVPSYRTDILHWIDIAEEIAIAYGYENFESVIPQISTIAQENPAAVIKKTIANILSGLQLLECSSYHLTTRQNVNVVYPGFTDFIEVEESKTEYNVLRNDLLTNLMKIISENSDSAYPQKIFELGKVFSIDEKEESGIRENENLSIAIADENANYTELKQILEYALRMLGKELVIEECEHDGFIVGRVGKIVLDGKSIGFIGEIHPEVLRNLKIKVPVSALELCVDDLF